MENVPGKYKFESQENFDEFLKAQGKTPFFIQHTLWQNPFFVQKFNSDGFFFKIEFEFLS